MIGRSAQRVSAGLMVALALTGPAHAQKGAPIQSINIVDIGGDLLFEGHYRKDHETRGASGLTTDEKDLFFREQIELRLGGYSYHPNLFDWDAALRLGVSQQRIDINQDSFDSDGTIVGYNLSGILLKEKPVSVRVYASKAEEFIDRSFARSIELDSRAHGAEVYFKSSVPISLLFEQSHTREESDLRIDDEQTDYLRFKVTDDRDRDWFTVFTYEHEDTDETSTFLSSSSPPTPQDLPDRRDELNLSNRWRFGDGLNPHRLSGSTRLLRRRGAFFNDLFSINQRLDLYHSETFSTFYRAQASYDDNQTQNDDLISGEVGLVKKYYQSLEVTGRVFGSDRQIDEGSEQVFGGFVDLDYQKRTGVGRYSSNLGLGTERETQRTAGGELSIRDEPVTLSGILPQRLGEPGIASGSIVVTDINNILTFVQGVDYRVQQIGEFTEVVRLVTGTIADGQTVLVDYTAGAARDGQFRTDRINWRHRLELDDLPVALFFEYRLRDEQIESGDDPGNLDREEVYLLGSELTFNDLTLIGEYEQRNQRLFPSSTAYRARGTYDRVFDDTLAMTLGGDYERLRYKDADAFGFEPGRDFLDRYSLFGHLTTKLRRNLIVRLEASYVDLRGRENDTLGRVGASANWSLGNLDVSISGYHAVYEQEGDDGTSDYVMFTLRRSF